MVLTKTVQDEDYKLIEGEVLQLKDCYKALADRGVKIEIGHEHRYWEYGMGLKAFHDWNYESKVDNPSIVDVGAGLGLLGPSLAWGEHLGITEVEPNSAYEHDRHLCNAILLGLKTPGNTWINASLKTFREWHNTSYFYDVVFCISVIEHVAADHEFLKSLADMVKQGGLLFLTTDIMPTMPPAPPKNGYVFDNLREHNYTLSDIIKKISYLNELGFEIFGDADLRYHGDKVFDYSFCSIAMRRK
jgi:SAM-dependent methyltransferase